MCNTDFAIKWNSALTVVEHNWSFLGTEEEEGREEVVDIEYVGEVFAARFTNSALRLI